MFIGHAAAAFAARRGAPGAPLALLTSAAFLPDMLWPIFLLLGWETVRIAPGATVMTPLEFVSYPYSHSLLMSIVWGAVIGGTYYLLRRDRHGAWVMALLVVSHWFLDVPMHARDLPLWPGASSPKVGWGWWNSIILTYLPELVIYATGLALYLRSTRATDRVGSWGLWAYVLFLAVVFFASGGSPPPSERTLAWMALAIWIFVPWAWWVDRHRVSA